MMMLSALLVGERQRIHVALAQARLDAGGLELDPGKPEHLRRAVDADRLAGARAEQFDHPAGAGADVDEAAERPLAKRAIDRALDLALGDVERADLVPDLGVAGEIAVGSLGALGADRFGPRRVGGEQCLRRRRPPSSSISANSGSTRSGLGEGQEHPAAFLAPLENSGIGEDLEMARDARLALAENLRKLADRQLHQPQKREDAQPRRIGKRLEAIGKREASQSRDKDIKISLYGQFSRARIIPCALVEIVSYCRRAWPERLATRQAGTGARSTGAFEGSGTIMKKVAIVTVAVLALGLAACNKNNADNNAANETAVENTASTDVNAATDNAGAANADAALNAAGNDVDNAGERCRQRRRERDENK